MRAAIIPTIIAASIIKRKRVTSRRIEGFYLPSLRGSTHPACRNPCSKICGKAQNSSAPFPALPFQANPWRGSCSGQSCSSAETPGFYRVLEVERDTWGIEVSLLISSTVWFDLSSIFLGRPECSCAFLRRGGQRPESVSTIPNLSVSLFVGLESRIAAVILPIISNRVEQKGGTIIPQCVT